MKPIDSLRRTIATPRSVVSFQRIETNSVERRLARAASVADMRRMAKRGHSEVTITSTVLDRPDRVSARPRAHGVQADRGPGGRTCRCPIRGARRRAFHPLHVRRTMTLIGAGSVDELNPDVFEPAR